MTTTNYDEIAETYQTGTNHPIKQHVETFTILQLLGDIRARSVLDLACGQGYYTRLLKKQGAARVLGVDLSKKMIHQARIIEEETPLDIEYRIEDVAKLGQLGCFDLVTAVYLFPYASTQQTFTAMCQTISNNLKPGGKLIAITLNPHLSTKDLSAYKQYGISMAAAGALQDKTKFTFTVELPAGLLEMVTSFWTQVTYENTLRDAGFDRIIWHSLQISKEGIAEYGKDYWQAFSTKPYGIVLEGRKAG